MSMMISSYVPRLRKRIVSILMVAVYVMLLAGHAASSQPVSIEVPFVAPAAQRVKYEPVTRCPRDRVPTACLAPHCLFVPTPDSTTGTGGICIEAPCEANPSEALCGTSTEIRTDGMACAWNATGDETCRPLACANVEPQSETACAALSSYCGYNSTRQVCEPNCSASCDPRWCDASCALRPCTAATTPEWCGMFGSACRWTGQSCADVRCELIPPGANGECAGGCLYMDGACIAAIGVRCDVLSQALCASATPQGRCAVDNVTQRCAAPALRVPCGTYTTAATCPRDLCEWRGSSGYCIDPRCSLLPPDNCSSWPGCVFGPDGNCADPAEAFRPCDEYSPQRCPPSWCRLSRSTGKCRSLRMPTSEVLPTSNALHCAAALTAELCLSAPGWCTWNGTLCQIARCELLGASVCDLDRCRVEHGVCRTPCPTPAAPVWCRYSGLCAASWNLCVGCGTGYHQCWDSTCVANVTQCSCPPYRPVRCASGGCVSENATCRGGPFSNVGCNTTAPLSCWDGSCTRDLTKCPCPPSAAVSCGNHSTCAAIASLCAATCPPAAPYKCWNSRCVADRHTCECRPDTPYRCGDGSCQRVAARCTAARNGTWHHTIPAVSLRIVQPALVDTNRWGYFTAGLPSYVGLTDPASSVVTSWSINDDETLETIATAFGVSLAIPPGLLPVWRPCTLTVVGAPRGQLPLTYVIPVAVGVLPPSMTFDIGSYASLTIGAFQQIRLLGAAGAAVVTSAPIAWRCCAATDGCLACPSSWYAVLAAANAASAAGGEASYADEAATTIVLRMEDEGPYTLTASSGGTTITATLLGVVSASNATPPPTNGAITFLSIPTRAQLQRGVATFYASSSVQWYSNAMLWSSAARAVTAGQLADGITHVRAIPRDASNNAAVISVWKPTPLVGSCTVELIRTASVTAANALQADLLLCSTWTAAHAYEHIHYRFSQVVNDSFVFPIVGFPSHTRCMTLPAPLMPGNPASAFAEFEVSAYDGTTSVRVGAARCGYTVMAAASSQITSLAESIPHSIAAAAADADMTRLLTMLSAFVTASTTQDGNNSETLPQLVGGACDCLAAISSMVPAAAMAPTTRTAIVQAARSLMQVGALDTCDTTLRDSVIAATHFVGDASNAFEATDHGAAAFDVISRVAPTSLKRTMISNITATVVAQAVMGAPQVELLSPLRDISVAVAVRARNDLSGVAGSLGITATFAAAPADAANGNERLAVALTSTSVDSLGTDGVAPEAVRVSLVAALRVSVGGAPLDYGTLPGLRMQFNHTSMSFVQPTTIAPSTESPPTTRPPTPHTHPIGLTMGVTTLAPTPAPASPATLTRPRCMYREGGIWHSTELDETIAVSDSLTECVVTRAAAYVVFMVPSAAVPKGGTQTLDGTTVIAVLGACGAAVVLAVGAAAGVRSSRAASRRRRTRAARLAGNGSGSDDDEGASTSDNDEGADPMLVLLVVPEASSEAEGRGSAATRSQMEDNMAGDDVISAYHDTGSNLAPDDAHHHSFQPPYVPDAPPALVPLQPYEHTRYQGVVVVHEHVVGPHHHRIHLSRRCGGGQPSESNVTATTATAAMTTATAATAAMTTATSATAVTTATTATVATTVASAAGGGLMWD